jgi:hypothetical protein
MRYLGGQNELVMRLNHKPINYQSKDQDNQFYHHFMPINPGNLKRELFLYPLAKSQMDKVRSQIVGVIQGLIKLGEWMILKPERLKLVGLEELDNLAIKKRRQFNWFDYGRVDTILGNRGYELIEVNAKRPQLYEEVSWLEKRLTGSLGKSVVQSQLVAKMIGTINNNYRENYGQEPETIVIISSFLAYVAKSGIPYEMLKQLKIYFKNSKILIIKFEDLDDFYQRLKIKQNALLYDKDKIDLIIIKDMGEGEQSIFWGNGKIRNQVLARAYQMGIVELSNPPAAGLIGNKLALGVLKNPEIQSTIGLNPQIVEALNIIPDSKVINSLEAINNEWKDWMIKIPNIGSGFGVYAGKDMADDINQRRKLIEDLQYGPALAQRMINFQKANVVKLDTGEVEMAWVTLDPFVVNSGRGRIEIPGCFSKAITKETKYQYPRFNPDNRREVWFGTAVEIEG